MSENSLAEALEQVQEAVYLLCGTSKDPVERVQELAWIVRIQAQANVALADVLEDAVAELKQRDK